MKHMLIGALLVALAGCDTPPADAPQDRGAAATSAKPASDCELVMGWNPWPPYHYRDVGGSVEGLEVEIVNALADSARCDVRFVEDEWRDLLRMLRDGEIDLLTGATRTDEREQYALFSQPYRHERFVLYVRAGQLRSYPAENLAELLEQGFRVGLTDEYIYGEAVEALRDNAEYGSQFVAEALGAANYIKLLNGEIDGFLEDPVVASDFLRRNGLDEQIASHNIGFDTGEVALMFSKASVDDAVLDRINAALEEIRANGVYDRIIGRYLLVGPRS